MESARTTRIKLIAFVTREAESIKMKMKGNAKLMYKKMDHLMKNQNENEQKNEKKNEKKIFIIPLSL